MSKLDSTHETPRATTRNFNFVEESGLIDNNASITKTKVSEKTKDIADEERIDCVSLEGGKTSSDNETVVVGSLYWFHHKYRTGQIMIQKKIIFISD